MMKFPQTVLREEVDTAPSAGLGVRSAGKRLTQEKQTTGGGKMSRMER
jgi:hypothetical protein